MEPCFAPQQNVPISRTFTCHKTVLSSPFSVYQHADGILDRHLWADPTGRPVALPSRYSRAARPEFENMLPSANYLISPPRNSDLAKARTIPLLAGPFPSKFPSPVSHPHSLLQHHRPLKDPSINWHPYWHWHSPPPAPTFLPSCSNDPGNNKGSNDHRSIDFLTQNPVSG
jgi:hypothetical protein